MTLAKRFGRTCIVRGYSHHGASTVKQWLLLVLGSLKLLDYLGEPQHLRPSLSIALTIEILLLLLLHHR